MTEEPVATQSRDSWHFIFTGEPGRDAMPTQHDERTEDDAVVSQTLTCQTPQLLDKKPISKFHTCQKKKKKKTIQLKK